MPCTPSYCDDHDFQVAAPWCRYKWALAREAEQSVTIETVRREIWQAIDEVHDELRNDLQVSRLKKRPFQTQPKPEDKPFKGFNV